MPAVSPPLPSRAYLIIGVLATTTLVLLALLVLQGAGSGAATPPPPRAASAADESGGRMSLPALEIDENAAALPSALQERLEAYSTESLLEDLSTVLEAVNQTYEPGSAVLHPALVPHLERVARRLNGQTGAFNVQVSAPGPELAAERTAALRAALDAAGLEPGKLIPTAQDGDAAIYVEPI